MTKKVVYLGLPVNKTTSLFKDVKKTKETTLVNLAIPSSSPLSMESTRKQ